MGAALTAATAPAGRRAGAAPAPPAARALVERTAEEVLDHLQVTDRVYHHLDYTRQLVVEVAARLVTRQPAPARVLVVGSDSLLAHLLLRLGYELDLWHFPQGHLTGDLDGRVRATVEPEQLAADPPPLPRGGYAAILLPLVLEALPGKPTRFLAHLRHALRPGGSLIVATTNANRLDLRLLTATGRSTAAAYEPAAISLSFPPLPHVHYYHRDDLRDLARRAGLWVRELAYVMAHQACSQIDPFPPRAYATKIATHWLASRWTTARHAIVLDLAVRAGDDGGDGAAAAPPAAGQFPAASVIVAARQGGEDLGAALRSLAEQHYPADRLEAVVIHGEESAEAAAIVERAAGGSPFAVRALALPEPEGPTARNAAMRAARGDLCIHIDDACAAPPGWLEAIGMAFLADPSLGVLTGPVLEQPGSHPYMLVLPGSRILWEHKCFYPVFNVAYRREAALAVGGFAEGTNGQRPMHLGWDSELAYRLQRRGWFGRHSQDVFLYRRYEKPQRGKWIAEEWRVAQELPYAVAQAPELGRKLLFGGRFASPRTFNFDLFVVGLLAGVARRERRWLALGMPWALQVGEYFDAWPPSNWPSSARLMGALGLRHAIWLAGLVRGSLKARRVVL